VIVTVVKFVAAIAARRSCAYKEPQLCNTTWSCQASECFHTCSRLKITCRLRVSSIL